MLSTLIAFPLANRYHRLGAGSHASKAKFVDCDFSCTIPRFVSTQTPIYLNFSSALFSKYTKRKVYSLLPTTFRTFSIKYPCTISNNIHSLLRQLRRRSIFLTFSPVHARVRCRNLDWRRIQKKGKNTLCISDTFPLFQSRGGGWASARAHLCESEFIFLCVTWCWQRRRIGSQHPRNWILFLFFCVCAVCCVLLVASPFRPTTQSRWLDSRMLRTHNLLMLAK